MATYTIDLIEGWNLISLPLVPDVTNIEIILRDILDITLTVWHFDAVTGEWDSFHPGTPSDLTEIVDGKAYFIGIEAPVMLEVSGADARDVLPAYPVVKGYNHIGFTSLYPRLAHEDYLAGIHGKYKSLHRFNRETDANELVLAGEMMNPGDGFWIEMLEAGVIYPYPRDQEPPDEPKPPPANRWRLPLIGGAIVVGSILASKLGARK